MPVSIQTPWLAWVQAVFGLIALVLAVLSFMSANSNRARQEAVAQNQSRLERANTFSNLDNGLIQLAAKTAADNSDSALTALLAQNGVTFRPAPSATAATSGARP